MKQTILAALASLLLAHQALAETLPMPVEKLGEVQGVPFYKGYGSSIDADPQNPNRFYGLTDRGPNADGGEDVKIFLLPHFTPSIGHFEIQANGKIKKLRDIPLRDAHGKPLTGLPNPAGYGTSKETVVDANHQLLQRDKTGIDSEGLAVMRDGTFWVSDEYGPHIVHFDRNGIELERMSPRGVHTTGRRLPAMLGHLRPNRGMEGITTTPSNRVLVGIMQSALYNPSKQAVVNKSVTRILMFDLATGKTKQYLYQQGGDFWKNSEIRAIDEHRFLVDEHNGKDVKHVYLIDLNGATDVSDPADSATGLKVNGKAIEENSWEELAAAGIKPVRKTLVSDVKKDVDFQSSKFEGMWVADGGKTLWIINDDDFGIDSKDDHTIVPKRLPNGQTDATRLYRIPLNIK
ncbi:esterase-like activity of phytase family protein [Neisseria bacilliformis]|uniref:3-phytase n=1 Tax=Neisseria bacilliformis ATCC BAA-1200 TaxID=888742 RepID=F2BA46_9NEIS|nr:esterase-like activity of phytase family protein [Neisseria bacilliformis]EGF11688.1 3-phytase [Neisseria bacilliformis ATCC BAA-1200]QMT47821.1 esterase-like activity of phytase family protein [Neisseria bacilliformis]